MRQEGRDPGNQAGPRPRGREPSSPRPGPACRRLPFPPRPQETSRHRGGKTPPLSSRTADPSHLDLPTPLADDEDLQGGQHALVHPDPAPHREQLPPLPLLSPSPYRGELPRMRPAPPGGHLFHTGCLAAGARDAPVPPGSRALRLRKTRRSGLPSGRDHLLRKRRGREPEFGFTHYFSCLKLT